MKRGCLFGVLALSLVLAGAAQASEQTGIYALVEEVVLEPSADKPERILIRGVFMNEIDLRVQSPNSPTRRPSRGWMSFKLAKGKETHCRIEWRELRALAGKGNVVAFGSMDALRLGPEYSVANTVKTEKPTGMVPNAEYPINHGLYLLRKDSEPATTLKAVP